MTFKSRSAAYALNSYTWKVLESNLEWVKYKGVPPIIPTSQQPEIMQSGNAFVVYGSAHHPADYLYELNKEAISYNVYATTTTEANNVAELLYEVFKRQDDAADDVNSWLDVEGLTRTGGSRGITFGSIKSVMVEKAEPSDEEGGYVSALVLIEVKYTMRPQVITTKFES